jgi:glycosyltransferase domain-containing protein
LQNLTIIIPTFNRSELLVQTLRYLQARAAHIPILVADGSDESHATKNAQSCRSLGGNISYFHLIPHETTENYRRFVFRNAAALDRVQTPYVVFCGDDERLIVETALKAAEFLDRNQDFIAAHGTYLYFRFDQGRSRIESVCYETPSIDGDETGARLIQLYANYEPLFYAVFRTAAQRRIFEYLRTVPGNIYVEICHSTASIVAGKIKRLGEIYYLRNTGVPMIFSGRSWVPWLAADFADFYGEYRRFRDGFLEWIYRVYRPEIDEPSLGRTLDMMFVFYLSRGFDLRYWLEEALSVAVRDRATRRRLRDRIFGGSIPGLSALNNSSRFGTAKAIIRRIGGEPMLQFVRAVRYRLSSLNQKAQLGDVRLGSYTIAGSLWVRFAPEEWGVVCASDANMPSGTSLP